MPEPNRSTGVQPSAEAIDEADTAIGSALRAMRPRRTVAAEALTAAYAIDTPSIHAAGVAEGRAEVAAWLRGLPAQEEVGRDLSGKAVFAKSQAHRLADAIEAAFPTTGEPKAGRPLPCWKTLVGRGGDTWDPVCGLVRGHDGPCSDNPRDWPKWSDGDWGEACFPSEGTT